MKTRFFIIVGIVILFPLSVVYGLEFPMTTQEVLDEFDLIVLGTITDEKQIEGKPSTFTIEIEEIVKSPDTFGMPKTVLAVGCIPDSGAIGVHCPAYNIGQRGLFLLKFKNGYEISSASQVSEPRCTSEQFLANYRGLESSLYLIQDGQSKRFFTGKPTDIQFPLNNREMKEKDYSVTLSAYSDKFAFSDVVNGTIKECISSVNVTTSFVPPVMGTYGFNVDYDGGGFSMFGLAIIDYGSTPLAQYNAGVHGQDVWCKDELFLILKNDDSPNITHDNHTACVTKNTLEKLVSRGWGYVLE